MADIAYAGYEVTKSTTDATSWGVDTYVAAGTNRMWILFANTRTTLSGAQLTASIRASGGDPVEMHKLVQTYYYSTYSSVTAFYLLESELPAGEYHSVSIALQYGKVFNATFCQFNNVKQSAPAYDTDIVSGTSVTSAVTTQTDKAMIVGYAGMNHSTSIGLSTDTQTAMYSTDAINDASYGYFSQRAGYEEVPTAGAVDMTWSTSATRNIGQILLALEPVIIPNRNSAILSAAF